MRDIEEGLYKTTRQDMIKRGISLHFEAQFFTLKNRIAELFPSTHDH
jgi:hypothetical protein